MRSIKDPILYNNLQTYLPTFAYYTHSLKIQWTHIFSCLNLTIILCLLAKHRQILTIEMRTVFSLSKAEEILVPCFVK